MKKKINYSLIIPAYNEIGNLPILIQKCNLLIKRKLDLEVLIVNNGSTDGTFLYLSKALKNNKEIRVINIKKNKGYGCGIVSGLKNAKGNVLGWTHADLQTDPMDFIKAINLYEISSEKENIYIKGKRIKRFFIDKIFTFGMSLFEFFLLSIWMEEINAQPNLFHKSFFLKWSNPPKDSSLDLYVYYLAKRLNMKFIRYKVNFDKRKSGFGSNESLIQKIKYSFSIIKFSFKLKFNLMFRRSKSYN